MNVVSLLGQATSADVVMDPYPHLVVKNALPENYYSELERTYPSISSLKQLMQDAISEQPDNKKLKRTLRHLKRRNRRVNIPSAFAMKSQQITPLWQDFVSYHSSAEFFHEMVDVFGPAIEKTSPKFPAKESSISRRGSSESTDVTMETLIAMNTPSWLGGNITGPHTDHPSKLFIGLFYLRMPEDEAGGDLLIYRRTEPVTAKNLKWPKENSVQAVARVKYEPNTLVLLLNSDQSVHGVTTRKASKYPRRFVNLIAETQSRLF